MGSQTWIVEPWKQLIGNMLLPPSKFLLFQPQCFMAACFLLRADVSLIAAQRVPVSKPADPLVQNIVYRSTYVFHRKPHFLPSTQLRSWKLHHLQKELRTFFLTSTSVFVASFFPKWGVSENSLTKKRTLMVQEFMTIIPTTHDHIFGGKSWQIPWNQGVDPSPGTWRPTYGPWSMVMAKVLPNRNQLYRIISWVRTHHLPF